MELALIAAISFSVQRQVPGAGKVAAGFSVRFQGRVRELDPGELKRQAIRRMVLSEGTIDVIRANDDIAQGDGEVGMPVSAVIMFTGKDRGLEPFGRRAMQEELGAGSARFAGELEIPHADAATRLARFTGKDTLRFAPRPLSDFDFVFVILRTRVAFDLRNFQETVGTFSPGATR
jgi:hypothetical protein